MAETIVNYLAGTILNDQIYNTTYYCQSFKTSANTSKLNYIQIQGQINQADGGGDPPTTDINVKIYLADANHKPTGSVIASTTISSSVLTTSKQTFTLTFNQAVSPNTEYVFVMSAPGRILKYCFLAYHYDSRVYTDGYSFYSTNSGVSWTSFYGTGATINLLVNVDIVTGSSKFFQLF